MSRRESGRKFRAAGCLTPPALSYGAGDLHGTINEEHIFHGAGATSPQWQTEMEVVKAIRETRHTPVQT